MTLDETIGMSRKDGFPTEVEKSPWEVLFHHSRDGIVILDKGGGVYEANRQFASMLGYSLDELRQLQIWDWDHKFQKHELECMLRDIGEDGHHFETRHLRKDGTVIDVELSNVTTTINGQKLIFCLCRDITPYPSRRAILRSSPSQTREPCPKRCGSNSSPSSLPAANRSSKHGQT
ncbi:MAG: PAS domain S-box protein [Synergistales bacterium]|nr:PAS domain S-box protein [Synergistales bacterium]